MLELMDTSGELTSRVALTELLLGLFDVKSLLSWNHIFDVNDINGVKKCINKAPKAERSEITEVNIRISFQRTFRQEFSTSVRRNSS